MKGEIKSDWERGPCNDNVGNDYDNGVEGNGYDDGVSGGANEGVWWL